MALPGGMQLDCPVYLSSVAMPVFNLQLSINFNVISFNTPYMSV